MTESALSLKVLFLTPQLVQMAAAENPVLTFPPEAQEARETMTGGNLDMLLSAYLFRPAETGKQAVFIVNRSQTEAVATELIWQSGAAPARVAAIHQLAGTDVDAENTFENPNNVVPVQLPGGPVADGKFALAVPALSFTAIILE